MNLKNRLKRIEQSLTAQNPKFCVCFGRFPEHAFILIPTNERKPNSLEVCKALPEHCETCGKPVDRSRVVYPSADYWETVNKRVKSAAATVAMFED